MKNCIIIFFLFFVSSYTVAQTRLGLRISPTISANRLESKADSLDLANNGAALRFIAGIFADKYLGGSYYFSTGLFYAPKRVSYEVTNNLTGSKTKEIYNLQYVLLPLSLKLLTSEIALDTRLYFQVGVNLEVKIHEEAVRTSELYVNKFRNLEASSLLGLGVERRISTNVNLYGGFTYYRGLFNVASSRSDQPELIVKNDLFSLDFMIRF
ncbi:outer membrane beta-barrel protein [Fulvivirgaceae bacterium BMA12]|uniref:Outer membrane beta-barrel protein n=1 Tax=Agaribacillus aureus TaxID=3051825 RepID=A0ABT8LH77_9BACT|nr:outer membrane beta-barrel protein [Fulvivirgaceae bacterium BMA12]